MTNRTIPRIAVFDADAGECAQTAAAVLEYFKEGGAQVSEFCEMQAFVRHFRERLSAKDDSYDMVFLGVDGMLGVETGRNIRELDMHCAIFHISHSEDYTLEAFRQQTRNYLIKPVDPKKIEECVHRLGYFNPRKTVEE